MRLTTRLLAIAILSIVAAFPVAARADVIDYHFDISLNVRGADGHFVNPVVFSLDVLSDGYITSTGLAPLPAPLPTPLGYSVTQFGTSDFGWSAFASNDPQAGFVPNGFDFSLTSFLFEDPLITGYIQAPGVYTGFVDANALAIAPVGLQGSGILSVSDLGVAPEPSTFLLLGTGILGVAGAAWRKFLIP